MTPTMKNLLIAEGFYFLLDSIAIWFLMTSTADWNTKIFGVIGFIAMLWVTIAWLVIARNSERRLKVDQ